MEDENIDNENIESQKENPQEENNEENEDSTPELSVTSTNTNEDSEEDDISPDDEKIIEKVVDKKLAGVNDTLYAQRVETELQNIFTQNPEYKPFEKRIRSFVNHENRRGLIRQGLPVRTVAIEAVEPYLQKIGAEKARLADEKASKTRSAGSSQSTQTETPSIDLSKMKSSDITNMAEQIKSGRFKA